MSTNFQKRNSITFFIGTKQNCGFGNSYPRSGV